MNITFSCSLCRKYLILEQKYSIEQQTFTLGNCL